MVDTLKLTQASRLIWQRFPKIHIPCRISAGPCHWGELVIPGGIFGGYLPTCWIYIQIALTQPQDYGNLSTSRDTFGQLQLRGVGGNAGEYTKPSGCVLCQLAHVINYRPHLLVKVMGPKYHVVWM